MVSLAGQRAASPPASAFRLRLAISPGNAAMWGLLLLVGFLVLFPLGTLFYGSFLSAGPGRPGILTLHNYVEAYTSPNTVQLLVTTLLLMGGKTVVATALAVLLALIVVRTDVPLRRLLEMLISLPFFVPPILETIGWIMLLSPKTGTINVGAAQLFGSRAPAFNIYSLGGMLLVLALNSSAFMFLLIVSALRNMDSSLEEAARMAGANPRQLAVRVTLPLAAPAVLGASLLSFIRALEAFEVPVLIGLPAKIQVLPSRIFAAVEYDSPSNYGLATALGVGLTVLTLGLILAQHRLIGDRQFALISGKGYRSLELNLGPLRYVAMGLCLLFILTAAVLPLSQLLIGSVSRTFGLWEPGSLTLTNYAQLFTDEQLWRGLRNTLAVGAATAAITMLLSSLIAYVTTRTAFAGRRLLDTVSWLPWTVPGIVAGLGFLWAYIRFPLHIYGTVFLLGIAFLTGAIPLGVRLMSSVMVQVGKELEESARTQGASWRQTYMRIVLPLTKPALLAGSLILFVTFARALSSVVLLTGPGTELLSVVLFKYLGAGRLEVVCALSVVMLAINLAGLGVAKRMGFFGPAN